MKWSLSLGKIAGIELKVHATFTLIIIWIAVIAWLNDQSLVSALSSIAFVLALFGCVVLHELGHALAARRFGIPTRDITLLPIGGVARLQRMPDQPLQELVVAVAGPAVNVVIAAVLYVLIALTNSFQPVESLSLTQGAFWERLMLVNIFLVIFNMIPAFPMDGGRVLRALLALRLSYSRATEIAGGLGQSIAFLFAIAGLFWNPFLIFIALFVWIGASQETSLVMMRAALDGIPVEEVMITDFKTLDPYDTLETAAELILTTSQRDFPVVEDEIVVGILTSNKIMSSLADAEPNTHVESVMDRDVLQLDANTMMESALVELQSHESSLFPVLKAGRLVGILTMENLGEYVSIHSALEKNRDARRDARRDAQPPQQRRDTSKPSHPPERS